MGRSLDSHWGPVAPHSRHGRPSGPAAALLGDHILDVAIEHFLASGYAGTRMETVAANAQVTKRTLYQRYGDKQGLFKAVRERVGEKYLQASQLGAVHGSLRQQIADTALALLDVTLTPQTLMFEQLKEEVKRVDSQLTDDLQQRVTESWAGLFQAILAAAPDLGNCDDEELAFLAFLLLDALVTAPRIHILTRRTLENTASAKAAFIARALDRLIAGMPFLDEPIAMPAPLRPLSSPAQSRSPRQ